MDGPGSHVVDFLENEFDSLTEKQEIYVEPQPEKAARFKQLSEKCYNSAIEFNKNCKGKFLPKLLTNGFNAEQVWQQCDLFNKAALSDISLKIQDINCKNIFHAISKVNKASRSTHAFNKSLSESEGFAFSDAESNAEKEFVFDDDSNSPSEMDISPNKKKKSSAKKGLAFNYGSDTLSEMDTLNKKKSSTEKEYAFDDDSDEDEDDYPSEKETILKKRPSLKEKKKSNASLVDDQFFKLSELEEFLKLEDLKEEKGIEKHSDDEDNDIDLFQDIPSDSIDESDEESVNPKKSSKDIMYGDFFDNPELDYDENIDCNEDDTSDLDEKMMEENDEAFSDENNSDAEVSDDCKENDNFKENAENDNSRKTAFELEQEKIRKKIEEYEKSMIEPLPWHLTGEVDVSKRPIDSLIHKETDFDSNVKEDLIVDNALTETIEEIVKRAIMNKAFNDVERKYKPTEDVMAYKKEVALEQTKSKKGLAEVYEEEYLKKQNKQGGEEEDPKHKEIKKLMDSLFPELYALFTHIPVPSIPEIKIVSNLPAVTVEEVAPITMSDATLLAPEEVKKKSGQIKSQTERTETDRKRERRKKKVHQKLKEKKRLEKLEAQKGNPSAKVSKLEKQQTLKKLKQHRNTKIATVDDGGKIKSSKDFFSRLQDTVDSKNRNKTQNSPKKKKK